MTRIRNVLPVLLLFAILINNSHAIVPEVVNIGYSAGLAIVRIAIAIVLVLLADPPVSDILPLNLNPPPTYNTIVNIEGLGLVGGALRAYDAEDDDQPPGYYYQFKGIPYAEPAPRFTLAQPKQPWDGVLNAVDEGPACPQPFVHFFSPRNIDENRCLVLTVTTPRNPNTSTEKLPVLFWIHGGIMLLGYSHTDFYDPQVYARNDVIIVQPNYRLCTMGWITDGEIIPRNIGLKDVRLALKWTYDHISNFGGDPSRITINGESAGSVMSAILWQSPSSRMHVNGLMMQSGTSLNVWSIQPDPPRSFAYVVQLVCGPEALLVPIELQVECLKAAPVDDLVLNNLEMLFGIDIIAAQIINGLVAAFVIEDESDETACLTMAPYQRIGSGDIINKPVFISMTNLEMMTFGFATPTIRKLTPPQVVPYAMGAADPDAIGKRIQGFYSNNTSWYLLSPKVLLEYGTDVLFNNAYRKFIEFVQPRLSGGNRLHCMQFSYQSPMALFHMDGLIGHMDDLYYTWKLKALTDDRTKPNIPKRAYLMRQQMARMYTNFVKYGDPTPVFNSTQAIDPLLGIVWPAVDDVNNVRCLDVNDQFSIITNVNERSYRFWDDLYAESNPWLTF